MGLLRCFIAIELPRTLQDTLATAIAEPRQRLGSDALRWVPVHNIHLTLKFLGDTAPSAIETLSSTLRSECLQVKAFNVKIGGFGAFPSPRKPRVLWVGLVAPPALGSLQHALDLATARLGYSSEDRDFSPHLTIARVRQNASPTALQLLRDTLAQTAISTVGTFKVDAVHLFQSVLGPGGSEYTSLFKVPLEQA